MFFLYLPSLPIVDLFTSGLFRVQSLVKVCLLRSLYSRRRDAWRHFLSFWFSTSFFSTSSPSPHSLLTSELLDPLGLPQQPTPTSGRPTNFRPSSFILPRHFLLSQWVIKGFTLVFGLLLSLATLTPNRSAFSVSLGSAELLTVPLSHYRQPASNLVLLEK